MTNNQKCKNCGSTETYQTYNNLMEKGSITCEECGYIQETETPK